MSFLQRFLSEDLTNCKLVDCIEEVKLSRSCSSNCLNECPYLCNIVENTLLSPPQVIHHEVYGLKKIIIISVSSIITTLFLLTLLVLCFKFYQRRRRRSITISRRWSIEEARNLDFDGSSPVIIDHPVWHIRTIGLNPTVISSIKVCKYSKSDGLVEGTDCSVCLSEFEEEESLRLLPKCKHAFHLSCIDTWLRSHTNCPLCRASIVVENTMKDDHSEGLEEISVMRVTEEDEEIERDLEEEERDDFVGDISRDHDQVERVRRSVSLDSLSGLRVSEVVVVGRGKEKVKRGNIGSSIVGRSSFLKRSISYSEK